MSSQGTAFRLPKEKTRLPGFFYKPLTLKREECLFELFVEAEGSQGEGLLYAVGECVFTAVVETFTGSDQETEGETEDGTEYFRGNVVFATHFIGEVAGVFDYAVGTSAGNRNRDTNHQTAGDAGGAYREEHGVAGHVFGFISKGLYVYGRCQGGNGQYGTGQSFQIVAIFHWESSIHSGELVDLIESGRAWRDTSNVSASHDSTGSARWYHIRTRVLLRLYF